MRFDRILTFAIHKALKKRDIGKEGIKIPILMYHSISDQEDSGCHPYFQTNTKPEIFSRHMQYLADNGYNVISLSDAVALISDKSSSSLVTQSTNQPVTPRKYCVLTWDDGFRDFHDTAWPILKKHGFTASMFIPTGYISDDRKQLNGRDCLTWDEVKALAGNGVTFGAHTVSHVQLYDLRKAEAKSPDLSFPRRRDSIDLELQASKRTIEERLGILIEHYSYAYAFPEHDRQFISFYEKSLQEAGYQCAVSTRIGTTKPGDNLYILKRIPANSHDDIELLRAKLEGGYDWLNRIQFMKKTIRFAG
jgi:peptidoglycan/xylan/chitin deacetylase (PgdA/CDA1 family)